jgi:hypothetical protein
MRKLDIFYLIILFSLFLLYPVKVMGFEPFPGNWVEVAKFEGKGSTQTKLFTCDYPEWRIKWQFTPSHEAFHFPFSLKFSITTFREDPLQDDYNPERQEIFQVINKIEPVEFVKTNIEILDDGAIASTIERKKYAESGISIINDHVGIFYLKIESSFVVDSYTIFIEQNVDAIPEFHSWIILPFCVFITVMVLWLRKG